MAFKPKGDRSLRLVMAETVAKASYGDLLPFGDLAAALGVPDDDSGRNQIRAAVAAARPVLLAEHSRAVVAVRGVGYRVALPGEFAGIATGYRDRADRSLQRAVSTIRGADESGMTADELRRHRAVGMVLTNLVGRMNATEQRVSDLEQAVFGRKPPTIPGEVVEESG